MAKLFHIPDSVPQYSTEGILRAKGKEISSDIKNGIIEVSGWFKDPNQKKHAVVEQADDLVAWLKEEDKKHPNLDLDVGMFKTWMKTSQTFRWRYYYMMHDATYHAIIANIEEDQNTKLEKDFNVNLIDRTRISGMLDKMKKIKDLITFTKMYKERCEKVFNTIKVRQKQIKGAPFQILLLGMGDLETTAKKIVNIAI